MQKIIYTFCFFLSLSTCLFAQNKRLQVSGSISADTLKTKRLLISTGNNSQLLLANGNAATLDNSFSLAGDSLSVLPYQMKKISLYKFDVSQSDTGSRAISPIKVLNQLNLTLSGNAISSTNWEVGGIYEIQLNGKLDSPVPVEGGLSFTTNNSFSNNPTEGTGISLSLIKWNTYVGDGTYLSNSGVAYFIPTASSQSLYLNGYKRLVADAINLKGTLRIRKLNLQALNISQ